MKHNLTIPDDGRHPPLGICRVCECSGVRLPTECPGYKCISTHGEEIFRGKIDFRDGKWIQMISKNSPAQFGPWV